MPKTKIEQVRCAFCPCLKDSQEGCKCYCHAKKEDLEFEEPEPQWNMSDDVVVELMDSQPSDSV